MQVVELNGGNATVDLVGIRVLAPSDSAVPVGPGWLVVRPEVVRLGAVAGDGIRGVVLDVAFRGSGFACQLDVEGLSDPLKAELSAESGTPPELGSTVGIAWDSAAVCLLSRKPE